MPTNAYIYPEAQVARGGRADTSAQRTSASLPTDSVVASPTDSPTSSLLHLAVKVPQRTSFWKPTRPPPTSLTVSYTTVPLSSSPTMSDDSAAAGPAPNTDGIETWKLVLAVLLPLLCIAIGACIFLYCQQRKQRAQKTDVEQVGTMLQDLKTGRAEVDAMKEDLQNGLERVKALEGGVNKKESVWGKSKAPSKQYHQLSI